MIYLDYAATTPPRPEVLEVYQQVARQYYGNASSLHDTGAKADRALQLSRKKIANIIRGEKEGIFFTSGGSEANWLALQALIKGNQTKGKHVITTEIEHASLYELFKQLETEGYEVTFLKVDNQGQVRVKDVAKAIRPDTIIASIQHANSETGVVQPIKEIGEVLADSDVVFHTDVVQTFGKIPINIQSCKIDSLSIASHKIYGPKGIGAAYIHPNVSWKPVQEGATHESGFRMGTVDVPGAVAFATAAELASQGAKEEYDRLQQLRNYFIKGLNADLYIEGSMDNQLPGIIGLTCNKVQGQHIMLECNQNGIHISTGSACQVGQTEPSRTMIATGKTRDLANGFFRISLGMQTTKLQLEQTKKILHEIMEEL